ncbi:unnamed protein product, partial [Sphacelaria rigidula]
GIGGCPIVGDVHTVNTIKVNRSECDASLTKGGTERKPSDTAGRAGPWQHRSAVDDDGLETATGEEKEAKNPAEIMLFYNKLRGGTGVVDG